MKLPCYGLVQVDDRVHRLAHIKFIAQACAGLTYGAQPPPQPYIQAAETQQLQVKQRHYLTGYGEQVDAAKRHVRAYAAVLH